MNYDKNIILFLHNFTCFYLIFNKNLNYFDTTFV